MPADRKPFRVLFVCMGNICRSPAAEIVFRQQVADAGWSDRIDIDSAGTIGYHIGNGPDPRMAETLRRRGYRIEGRARQVTAADLQEFDLILAADRENISDLRELDPAGTYREKVRLLVDFCLEHTASHVPDPYYGGQRGFEEVADLVADASRGLLAHIQNLPG